MKLNDEQKKLVEDNINLIYNTIKLMNNKTNNIDLIDIGYIALCKSALTYDDSKSKFSTYATNCIRNDYKKYYETNSTYKRKSNFRTISLNQIKEDGQDEMIDFISYEKDDIDELITKQYLDNLINKLLYCFRRGEKATKIIHLLQKEYTIPQIAEELNMTRTAVTTQICVIRKKAKEIKRREDLKK